MGKFIKIDFEQGFSSVCYTKQEVIKGCGYLDDEITWEEFLNEIKGEFEVIEIKGDNLDLRFWTED